MRKAWTIALGAALLAPVTAQAQAQDAEVNEVEVELYSEMWAMAGICMQYGRYPVRADALADLLNQRIGAAGPEQQSAIIGRKETKLEEIAATMNDLLAMSPGGRRDEALEENQMALMTRCQRLSSHSLAGEYFGVGI